MMGRLFAPRMYFFLVALACAALLGYALWVQHVDFLDPCPLCVFQRVAFAWIGLFALVAAVHNPSPSGYRLYGMLVVLGAAAGSYLAGRHVWLQSLPPDQVPECGPGLNYMIDTMPFAEVLSKVLIGDGSCAEVDWSFLGISMPGWTLLWFVGIGLVTLWVVFRKRGGES